MARLIYSAITSADGACIIVRCPPRLHRQRLKASAVDTPAPGRAPGARFAAARQPVQWVDGDGAKGWTSPRQWVIFGAGASGWIR